MKTMRQFYILILGIMTLYMQPAFAGSSQFIEDMPELTTDPDMPGAKIWRKPGLDRSAYTRGVVIEPITIFISPDSEYKGLNADHLKALSDDFQKTLTLTLEPEIPVLNKGGPGVLYFRAAIVNVKLTKLKAPGLMKFTPIGLVATTVADEAGLTISLEDAVLEAEMLDAVTGERLGVQIHEAPKVHEGDTLSWDSINKLFTFYAERFKARMLAAKESAN